jgi:hypothetical protein
MECGGTIRILYGKQMRNNYNYYSYCHNNKYTIINIIIVYYTMHKKIFLNAFRTSLIIVFSFIVYEFNIEIMKSLRKVHPELTEYQGILSKIVKFVGIFLLDLILLYIYAYFLKILP